MAFKFSPGDEVVANEHKKMGGWTAIGGLCIGTHGTVKEVKHESNDSRRPIIVCCDFPGVINSWWVYEFELDFADAPISVNISTLL